MRSSSALSDRFVDQNEIAAMLGIGRTTLYRLQVVGKFPRPDLVLSKTLRRWRLTTVEAWLADHAQDGEKA